MLSCSQAEIDGMLSPVRYGKTIARDRVRLLSLCKLARDHSRRHRTMSADQQRKQANAGDRHDQQATGDAPQLSATPCSVLRWHTDPRLPISSQHVDSTPRASVGFRSHAGVALILVVLGTLRRTHRDDPWILTFYFPASHVLLCTPAPFHHYYL